MPTFTHDGATLHYEEHGSGFPVLLLAPGGLRSTVAAWQRAPWNPVDELAPLYRVLAMDQRNAGGGSSGPVSGSDGWDTYTADQLAVLDHAGVERAHVLGMCIGGAFIANLLRTAPDRVAAAVALQPIGLSGNRERFHEMVQDWGEERGIPAEDLAGFRDNLYGGDDVLWSVSDADVERFRNPILVLMGDDEFHPQVASRTLARLAPHATLLETWKDPDSIPMAQMAVAEFLTSHTPA
ncbi:alpha/beta fold hydrolase [Pseudonocardia sp. RS010]|uniref:alpha/beta fold hydrolase n=1 Tax=Pseudonocardia sp. RS010 TaxID=3385979 RepID=UPI0039A1D86D